MLWLLVVGFFLPHALGQGASGKKEVCFKKVGCFPLEKPWYSVPARPIPPPEDPHDLDITLDFFSQPNVDKNTKITLLPHINTNGASIKADRERTIIIISSVGATGIKWPKDLKNALLSELDANIFIVNSSYAFRGLDTFQQVANSRVVGATVGLFVHKLQKSHSIHPDKVWAIGFGLGAQTASYISNYITLGRITGLDPMQEFFEGFPDEIHLDSGDAKFVDVIHSDARPILPDLGFGYMGTLGHVDFYLNGGHGQPGCKLPKASDIKTKGTYIDFVHEVTTLFVSAIFCAHQRSFRVFTESITTKNCTIWGYEGNKENFLRGVSNAGSEGVLTAFTALTRPCNMSICVPMGIKAEETKLRGIYIVTTAGEAPYCVDAENAQPPGLKDSKATELTKWVTGLIGSNKKQ